MFRQHQQNFTSSNTENKISLLHTRTSSYKTPARSLKHGKAVQDENTTHARPRTAGLTNRKKQNISFSTPLIYENSHRVGTNGAALTEITNQTPFIKHFPATPGPTSSKPQKSFVVFNDDITALSARRISSTRKRLKLPRSENEKFETPETRGNHWDVSDASTEASMIEEFSITEEDYGDVEYAPPTAIESEFDPGFDMPDYKDVGATLMSLFRQPMIPDDYDAVASSDGTGINGIVPLVCEQLGIRDESPDDILSFIDYFDKACNTTDGSPEISRQGSRSTSGSRHRPATQAKISTMNARKSDMSKPSAKPLTRRTGVATHTRIPSLSKTRMVRTPPPTRQTVSATPPPKILRGRATTTTNPPKTRGTTRVKLSNTAPRTANVSKLVTPSISMPKSRGTVGSHQPEKTAPSLRVDCNELEEDFFFKI